MENTNNRTKVIDEIFAEDVRAGLSSSPKFLHSKYFYDEKGDRLFQEIMDLDEYYLTRAEYSIFDSYKSELLNLFNPTDYGFQLIEFGAGDGLKTKVLLENFLDAKAEFKYVPIDISGNVLEILEKDLKTVFPELKVEGIEDDYFRALKRLHLSGNSRKVVLFLGSNIGNFSKEQSVDFLKKLNLHLSDDDLVLIGFDLKKDPSVILKAYDDSDGVTRAFNFNLLDRINNELGGEFDLDTFKHFPSYDPVSGETRSYLISKIRQQVYIHAIDETFSFLPWEPIYTEVSQKFNMVDVENLAVESGFRVKENFYDANSFFVDSVWELA